MSPRGAAIHFGPYIKKLISRGISSQWTLGKDRQKKRAKFEHEVLRDAENNSSNRTKGVHKSFHLSSEGRIQKVNTFDWINLDNSLT